MSALAVSSPVDLIPAPAPTGTVVMVGNCRYWFAEGTPQASIDKLVAKARKVKGDDRKRLTIPGFGKSATGKPSAYLLAALERGAVDTHWTRADHRFECPTTGMPDWGLHPSGVARRREPLVEPVTIPAMPESPVDMSELEALAARHRAASEAEVALRDELHATVRRMASEGVSQSDIARAVGWHRQHVYRLLNR